MKSQLFFSKFSLQFSREVPMKAVKGSRTKLPLRLSHSLLSDQLSSIRFFCVHNNVFRKHLILRQHCETEKNIQCN